MSANNSRRFCTSGLASLLVLASTSIAYAQLTAQDIQALRERGEREGWTFTVAENGATGYALDELCGFVKPEGWEKLARWDACRPRGGLPEAFDWRSFGGCTVVKNQASCGSCWAFATVGPLECNIRIRDGVTVDLSEQWLVSCNRDGWDCGGGFFAHDYHEWKTDPCNDTGALCRLGCPLRLSLSP
jgi:C1A family cysteine protease